MDTSPPSRRLDERALWICRVFKLEDQDCCYVIVQVISTASIINVESNHVVNAEMKVWLHLAEILVRPFHVR